MTATARVAALRQRRAQQGLVRLELYVHPDDRNQIKALAAALTARRCNSTFSQSINSDTIDSSQEHLGDQQQTQ